MIELIKQNHSVHMYDDIFVSFNSSKQWHHQHEYIYYRNWQMWVGVNPIPHLHYLMWWLASWMNNNKKSSHILLLSLSYIVEWQSSNWMNFFHSIMKWNMRVRLLCNHICSISFSFYILIPILTLFHCSVSLFHTFEFTI